MTTTTSKPNYDTPAHEYAKFFPSQTKEEFGALCVSIVDDGQLNPIIYMDTNDGPLIIDGRNRLRACKKMEVKPSFKLYTGKKTDAGVAGFIFASNMTTRQISSANRALMAGRISILVKAGRPNKKGEEKGETHDELAVKLGVSKTTVRKGRKVATAINDGKVSEKVYTAALKGDFTIDDIIGAMSTNKKRWEANGAGEALEQGDIAKDVKYRIYKAKEKADKEAEEKVKRRNDAAEEKAARQAALDQQQDVNDEILGLNSDSSEPATENVAENEANDTSNAPTLTKKEKVAPKVLSAADKREKLLNGRLKEAAEGNFVAMATDKKGKMIHLEEHAGDVTPSFIKDVMADNTWKTITFKRK